LLHCAAALFEQIVDSWDVAALSSSVRFLIVIDEWHRNNFFHAERQKIPRNQ